jgi:hypothetical protein
MPPIDWARRVNRSWLVRGGLDVHAGEWLRQLAEAGDGRLLSSCLAARAMCGLRLPLEDPKPWFYAGLFHAASPAEAACFLRDHPVTLAAVPAMQADPQVRLWMDQAGPEVRGLVQRLRDGLARLGEEGPVV